MDYWVFPSGSHLGPLIKINPQYLCPLVVVLLPVLFDFGKNLSEAAQDDCPVYTWENIITRLTHHTLYPKPAPTDSINTAHNSISVDLFWQLCDSS
jgi:hypothetical protein